MAKDGREYSWEDRERAEELYIVQGLTYEQVSQATGVSFSQVQRWAADGGWQERRREYRQALREIKSKRLELQAKLLGKALETLDPQAVYAAARMEAVLGRGEKKDGLPAPEVDRPAVFLEDLEFIANVLKETDPEGLKVLSRNFDALVGRFKAEHEKTA